MDLPNEAKTDIEANRSDIEFIHFDDCWYEDQTAEWVIPCEAKIEGAWMHGHMHVERIDGGGFDYFVGDWSDGMHPDLHTFER